MPPSIPGYSLNERLHAGPAYTVWRGRRDTTEEPVVVKVGGQGAASAQALGRLEHEFEVSHALRLDGVLAAMDLVRTGPLLALVLPDPGGVSLREVLSARSLPLDEILSRVARVARTLGQLHIQGLVHKDVNPANLIVGDGLETLLTDFGIAAAMTGERPDAELPDEVEGTLPYLAPEQTGRTDASIDGRTDLYALGATLYELLCGHVPFVGDDALELVHAHIAKVPPAPHTLRADVPLAVSRLTMKLLAKRPDDRYRTGHGVAFDLEQMLSELQSTGRIDPELALGTRDVPARLGRVTRLVGRDPELAALRAVLDRVANGARELVRVEGPSGVGKSALVVQAVRSVAARRARFVTGKYDQRERTEPYLALLQSFRGLSRQILSEPADAVRACGDRLNAALAPNGRLLLEVLPEFEPLLGPQPPVPALGAAEAQIRFTIVFRNFVRALAGAERPLWIFLDDAQWADGASLALIELLLTDPSLSHVAILLAFRDDALGPAHPLALQLSELDRLDVASTRIPVASLPRDGVGELVAAALGTEPSAVGPLSAVVFRKTAGNPFFVSEFLLGLERTRLLRFDPGALAGAGTSVGSSPRRWQRTPSPWSRRGWPSSHPPLAGWSGWPPPSAVPSTSTRWRWSPARPGDRHRSSSAQRWQPRSSSRRTPPAGARLRSGPTDSRTTGCSRRPTPWCRPTSGRRCTSGSPS